MPSISSITRLLLAGLALSLTACSQDNLVLPDEGQASKIVIVNGDGQSGPAGATLAQTLTVRVTDALDRPVANQPVVFAFPTGSSVGDVTPDTATTDTEGDASTEWVLGPTTGSQQVRAGVIVNGQIASNLTVTFTATATAGAATQIAPASGNNQTGAVGSALPDSLAVKVVDAFGNPVAGVEVKWTVSGGGSVDPATVVTGADGRAATRRVLGPSAGTQRAQAAAAGLTGSPVVFQHTAIAATPTRLIYVSGDDQQAPAGFPVADALTVRLVDANDNGIGGRSVTWVVGAHSGSVNPVNSTTDVDGYATTRWTLSGTVGSNLLNAVFSGLPSVPFTATGTVDVPSKMVLNGGNNQSAAVGTTLPTQLSVKVTDANNNPVAGVAVAWSAQGGGSVSALSTGTDDDGIARVNRTLGLLPGTYTTTATVTGLTGSPITFSSTATVGPAARLAIVTRPSSSASSGAALAQQPVVQLQDLGGNAVAQAGVLVAASVSGGVDLNGTRAVQTDADGRATFTDLSVSGSPGSYTLTFTAGVLLPVTSNGIALAAGAPAKLALITPPSSSVASGQAFAQQPVVEVEDAAGNPVGGAGRTVTAALASGGGTLGGTLTATTNSSSRATFADLMITGAAGARTLRFTSTGLTDVVSGSVTVSAGGATQIAVQAGNDQTAAAGSVLPVDPAVIVEDAGGNPVAGVQVTFAVASGGGGITGGVQTTNASGIATIGSWKLGNTAGTNTLTATAPGLTGSPITFTATGTAAAAAKLAIVTQPSSSVTSGQVFPQQPVIEVQDAAGNAVAVAGRTITAALASGGGTLNGDLSVTTDADGQATFTDLAIAGTAGNRTLRFTSSGLTVVVSSAITIGAGTATQIAVQAGNNQTDVAGGILDVDPAVIVRDASDNPVAGVQVTFAVASGGGSITGGVQTTNALGIATVGSWKLGNTVGTNTLTATSSGLAGSPVTFTATGTAGAASQIAVQAGDHQSATVGGVLPVNPSVVVRDANGNPVAGVQVTFAVASGGGSITGGTQTTNASGIATVGSWQLGADAGTNTLTATASGLTGSPVTFTATGTAAATTTTITSDTPDPSIAGQTVTVAFTVASASGTPTGTVTVSVSGGAESCSASVAAGSCDIVLNATGNRTLTATYAGDAGHAGSSGTKAHQVDAANTPPQGNDDAYNMAQGGSLTVNAASGVLSNDTDAESSPLTAALVTGPAQDPSFVLNADGSFTYTPAPGFTGTDTFTYRASDGSAESSVTTVTITVSP